MNAFEEIRLCLLSPVLFIYPIGYSPFVLYNTKATEGIRTLDPSLTKRLLYRLSYGGNH